MKKIVAQFIPILLLFLFLTQFTEFVRFSHTTLGKLVAVLIIVFYTFLDKVFGLFTCALVILFYQTDYIESMVQVDNSNIGNDIDDGLPIFTYEGTEAESKKRFPKGISITDCP